MIECDKHGLSFMALVCEHLADAVDRLVPAESTFLAGPYDQVYLLCEACCADLHLPPDQVWLDEEREEALFNPHRIRCLCEDCLEAWFVSTGQGRIEEAIEEARRRRRTSGTSSG